MSLTQARLHQLFDYDRDTGNFRRKVTASHFRAGTIAGTVAQSGYVMIYVDYKNYRAHRLAWLYVHGQWPAKSLDHKNCNRADNAFANLREATGKQQNANTKLRKDNASGCKGVHWEKDRQKFRAGITINGREKILGRFTTKKEAQFAYAIAARAEFGEFARPA